MSQDKWTTDSIPDLHGKVIIVTGGNSGLGYESVKVFSKKGAEVVLACRSAEKGESAKKEIGEIEGKIVVMPLDLMDFSSIKTFAENFKDRYKRLDVLLNNAGIMTTPYFLTKDGLEAQMGTNHFGHFALTGRLFETIKNTPNSRVVNVSSMAHKQGKMDFENLLFEKGKDYSPLKSYGRSKLANLLFTYELQRKFEENKIDSIAVSAHPGVSNTKLTRYVEDKWIFKLLMPLISPFIQESNMGALPQIRASLDENVKGSEYYGPDGLWEMKGFPKIVQSSPESYNKADAQKLWKISEEITRINIP